MPRVTLPVLSGGLFDSWDPASSGLARVFWLGAPPAAWEASRLVHMLEAWETLLHVVAPQPGVEADADADASWLIDRGNELARAFGATGPLAIVVDAADRVAALVTAPTVDSVAAAASRLYRASTPSIAPVHAPVLLLERIAEPALCRALLDYWNDHDKLANEVGSAAGNLVNAEVKRRLDVQVDAPELFVELRDCLVRRVVPAIERSFQTRIAVIEAPRIGCYDASSGGWFRRHRDNTSRQTAHRQFALSLNLNAGEEYDGGELRFPEFGRELYRPAAGAALVFSSSLLHEVMPVIRGRRFGVFTFLSASGPVSGPGSGTAGVRTAPR
jgi:predicted 2-oxoglutarate/Fe(II)-dependent dioxygenase YbiX